MTASLQYVHSEAAKTFKASGGDKVLTLTSLANGAGRYSDQLDRGSGAHAADYRLEVTVKAAAALAVGVSFEIYIATADATNTVIDGNLGTTDAALVTDKRRNLRPVGQVTADSTTNGELQVASFPVRIESRYITIAVWNALGQALTGTAGDHFITLIPMPPENQ